MELAKTVLLTVLVVVAIVGGAALWLHHAQKNQTATGLEGVRAGVTE